MMLTQVSRSACLALRCVLFLLSQTVQFRPVRVAGVDSNCCTSRASFQSSCIAYWKEIVSYLCLCIVDLRHDGYLVAQ